MRTTTLSTLAGLLLIGIPLMVLAPWILGMFGRNSWTAPAPRVS